MTEEQIEAFVCATTDALDRRYLAGNLAADEHRRKLAALDRWADMKRRAAGRRVPFVDVCQETVAGHTVRLSFQVRVF